SWLRALMLKSVGRCMDVLEAMGNGDLSQRVNWSGSDRLGRLGLAIDDFAGRISSMIGRIQRASVTVQTASDQSTQMAMQVDTRMKEELVALSQARNYSTDLENASGS